MADVDGGSFSSRWVYAPRPVLMAEEKHRDLPSCLDCLDVYIAFLNGPPVSELCDSNRFRRIRCEPVRDH
jgi:hypothetical protein